MRRMHSQPAISAPQPATPAPHSHTNSGLHIYPRRERSSYPWLTATTQAQLPPIAAACRLLLHQHRPSCHRLRNTGPRPCC